MLRGSSHIAIKDLTPCAARDWLNFWDPAQKIWDKFLVYKLNCSILFVCVCLKIDRISITAACAWTTTAGAADLCAGKRHPWPCNWISSVGTQLRTHTYQRPSTAKYLDLLPLSPDPKKWLSEWHLQACARAFMVPKKRHKSIYRTWVTSQFHSHQMFLVAHLTWHCQLKEPQAFLAFFPFKGSQAFSSSCRAVMQAWIISSVTWQRDDMVQTNMQDRLHETSIQINQPHQNPMQPAQRHVHPGKKSKTNRLSCARRLE